MPNSTQNKAPEYSLPNEENPEWTRERLQQSMRYPNLPTELMRIVEADKKKRGPQKATKKEAVSIRLSADVLDALRASGPGWQTRADEGLRSLFVKKQARKTGVLAAS